ncbi:hypothetical protein [Propionicimonas sp.]|uniref:hypothetical protein n=1 Tax=Propionicimonas sp. TaxID=1955623 RepID=UPI0039E3905E
MARLQQPWLGIIATTATVVVSLLTIAPWSYTALGGAVANVTMCSIPFTVVVGSFWRGREPRPLAALAQPWRGLGLLLIAAVVAVLSYALLSMTVGGGRGDTPFLAFGIILSVVVCFWLDVVWGGWPFSLVRSRLAGGIGLIASAYVVTGLLLRALDFSAFAGQPFYPGMDPSGPVPAWDGLVGGVTCLAVIFLFLHLDLWPLSRFPRLIRQPVLGSIWTVLVLGVGSGAYLLGTRVLGMTPDTFMVTVPVPFMFGTVVVLTMLEGSLTARLGGVPRGLASAGIAALVGTALAQLFLLLQPVLTPDVPAPAASGRLEVHLWLGSALLAVTFPVMAMYHDLFQLWPLAQVNTAPRPDRAQAPTGAGPVA